MKELKILLVDDDKNIRKTLEAGLRTFHCQVSAVESAEDAIKRLRQEVFDCVLTDYKLGGKTGVELVKDCGRLSHPPVVILMTAFASFENAVNAIQAGAFDYIPKPFTMSQVEHVLAKVRVLVGLKDENERLKSEARRSDYFLGMVSPAMVRLEEFIARAAPTDATILLSGESGTGKTELAKLIYERSARRSGPFVVLNCATLTESLLESELFGHVKGAFTGASHDHIGKLELAKGGTVFIDEIGELSPSAQARLLRFLQERVIERVGGTKPIEVDTRVIAATNKKLDQAVAEGAFREDLYYRLNIFECTLVPIRYRKEDLPVLIERFLKEFSARSGLKQIPTVPENLMEIFKHYDWPGNVRELRNCLERMVLLSGGHALSEKDLPDAFRKEKSIGAGASTPFRKVDDVVREHIERVLQSEPNQEKAADILGITTVTLWRKRKEYGLP